MPERETLMGTSGRQEPSGLPETLATAAEAVTEGVERVGAGEDSTGSGPSYLR